MSTHATYELAVNECCHHGHLSFWGRIVQISTNCPEFLGLIERFYKHFWVPVAMDRATYTIFRVRLCTSSDPCGTPAIVFRDSNCLLHKPGSEILAAMEVHIRMAAMLDREDFVILHAGAVVLDGVGCVFIADHNVGKSSMTIELVLTGGQYVSDDALPLDVKTGMVHPCPNPIKLSEVALERVNKRVPNAGAVVWGPPGILDVRRTAGGIATDPFKPDVLFFLSRQPASMLRIPPAEGLRKLLTRGIFGMPPVDRGSWRALATLVRSASCYALGRGPLEEMGVAVRSVALSTARSVGGSILA